MLAGVFFKLLACSCCRGCGVAGQSGPVRSGKRGPAGPGTFYEMNKGRSNFVLKPENWKTDVFFEGFQEQNFPVAFFAQERKTGRLSVQHLPECKHPPSQTRRIERFPLGLFDPGTFFRVGWLLFPCQPLQPVKSGERKPIRRKRTFCCFPVRNDMPLPRGVFFSFPSLTRHFNSLP